ncbi:MAG: hypothetical protein MUP11_05570 [Anaerolineales bacterium]|nr:hypothetical protein [Anaerolineales bacterium]
MDKKLIIFVVLLFCLPLFACSGVNTPEPANIDQPEIISESDPAPEPIQSNSENVTNIDQIVGTWIANADLGNFVVIITPDGKFLVATSLADLEQGSTDSWDLIVGEDQITATNFAGCPGDVGTYLANTNQDGTLKFTTITDPCSVRLRKMDRSLPGRMTPYNLVFHRVE